MNRAKLIERGATLAPNISVQTATTRPTAKMAVKVKVVKAWLTERRATQIEARQAFDALFN